jgi:SHS2 domain-containing protein
MYKFLEHTADLKVLVEEKSLVQAFSSSALALKEAIAEKMEIKPKLENKIEVSGKDKSALLYNFLEEFLYLLDAKNFLLSQIKELKISEKSGKFSLNASVLGDKATNYKFTNDVKAITYNEMKIQEKKGRIIIQFVLDV